MCKGWAWATAVVFLAAAATAAMATAAERPAAKAPQPEQTATELHMQRVALFKNGLGMFTAELALPEQGTSFVFRPPVAASHGTFWVSADPQVRLGSLVARKATLDAKVPAMSVAEFLAANVGRQVSVQMSGEARDTIEGKVVDVKLALPNQPQDAYLPGSPPPGRAGQLALLETRRGYVAINPQMAQRVALAEGDAGREYVVQRDTVELHGSLLAPAPGRKLTVSWLAKGITWAPSYLVDITDAKQARFTAKAEVINEAADLRAVDVALVTGFPHLRFADVVSPLAMKRDLASFLRDLVSGSSPQERQPMSNMMVQQQVGAYAYGGEAGQPAMPAFNANMPGAAAEDLFLYPLPKVDLAKGETGYYPLLDALLPYKHVHLWDIPDYLNDQEQYDQGRQQQPVESVVWHALRLTNSTAIPWTTAPAETVTGGQVLGQDIIAYTPVGGEATLKITVAVDVKADQAEFERERQRDALNFRGWSYDRVTVDGKLSVHNLKPDGVTVEITKLLSGDVQATKPEAAAEKLAGGLRAVNPLNRLRWTLTLKPGEEQQITYAYQVLVRR
jgi:hypothetical protein